VKLEVTQAVLPHL